MIDVASAVRDLRERGLEYPVMWLRDMMRMHADDMEEEEEEEAERGMDDEGVGGFALVPLTEDNEKAMVDEGFLRLLMGFGFLERIVGQEVFRQGHLGNGWS